MLLTIPHMETGYMLESGELNFRDPEHNNTINCHFLSADVCRWLDANGWKLYINQWHDRPMLAKAAPYPFAGFIMFVPDDGCDLVISAEIITQRIQNPRGGNHNLSESAIILRGEDPIELHKQMMAKAEELVDDYAQTAKEDLRYIAEPENSKESAK